MLAPLSLVLLHDGILKALHNAWQFRGNAMLLYSIFIIFAIIIVLTL